MEFEITDGLGKVRVGVKGDSFSFIRPLTFSWYDNYGSVGKFLCSLPYSEEYRKEVNDSIQQSLNADFTGNVEGLYKILLPLFKLFPVGKYSLNFYGAEDKDLFKYQLSSDNYEKEHLSDWELHFGNLTVANEESERVKEYQAFLTENAVTGKFYPVDILDYTTYNFYSGYDTCFLATQPKEAIDLERVAYFENEIKNGARPFAILYNCYFPDVRMNDDGSTTNYSIYSDYYVLDGHHKLLAYNNLGVYPAVATLMFLPKSKEEIMFDLDELKDSLYSWQFKHLKDNR